MDLAICSEFILCSFHKVLRKHCPIFLVPPSLPFFGYITTVDFIHFFQMKKNLLPAVVLSEIHFLTMGLLFRSSQEMGERGRKRKGERDRQRERGAVFQGSPSALLSGPQREGCRGRKGGMECEGGRASTEESWGEMKGKKWWKKRRGLRGALLHSTCECHLQIHLDHKEKTQRTSCVPAS